MHRGSSFEAALYDAQLKLHPVTEVQHFLVGCFDELTAEYVHIKDKADYWKRGRDNTLPLWQQSHTPGTIGGEGAAFFLLSNHLDHAIAAINRIASFYKPALSELETQLHTEIKSAGWKPEDIDLLVMGYNGDSMDEAYYNTALALFGEGLPVLGFKHLCGEYETSGGFALWLTCQLLAGNDMPEVAWYRMPADPTAFQPKKILYYNHYRGLNHNVILLEGM